MRVESLNSTNFGARVVLKNQYKDMLGHAPLKNIHNELINSKTNNVYEFGKSTFTNPQKTSGKHEILLNGEKFDEVVQTPQDGKFGLVKNFLQKCVEKENSLLPQISEEVATKLDSIRAFIKDTGLAIENVKSWL